jgi:hypothetical protein
LKRILKVGAVAALLAAAAAAPALAHHSFAMFDQNRRVILEGVVREVQWANPHAWIQVQAQPADGKAAQEWGVEAGSINMMVRQGWRSTTLKPGDKVGMVVHPMLNGAARGSLVSVTLADGRVLGPGGAAAPTTGNAPTPQ